MTSSGGGDQVDGSKYLFDLKVKGNYICALLRLKHEPYMHCCSLGEGWTGEGVEGSTASLDAW